MLSISNTVQTGSKFIIIIFLAVLAGCSSVPEIQPNEISALHSVDSVVHPGVSYPLDVYDPWEGMNRGIYRFNAGFDRYLFLPAVTAYTAVMPDILETGVSNFFNNLSDIPHLINSILQLKPKAARDSLGRLILNTTIGIGGLFDLATPAGIYEHEEDFGQTLAHYGVGNGPYLVLPILGPSNLRDTAGLTVDWLIMDEIDPLNLDGHTDREIAYYILDGIDTRHRTNFRYYGSGSPFEYEFIRLLYTKKRELDTKR